MNDKKSILIVAAHPDDEVLGCGGTIARLAQEGNEIYIALLGEGISSRSSVRDKADKESIRILHQQSHEVTRLLGAKDLFLYSLPDNRFDTVPLLDIVKIIEKLIEKINPADIYTHHAGDLNIDHVITNRAILTATRLIEGCRIKEVLTFEVPSSTEWSFGQYQSVFNPNQFVDIRETLEIKIEAMKMYKSEIRSFPHPRSIDAIQALARWRGSIVGIEAAEGFEIVRKIV